MRLLHLFYNRMYPFIMVKYYYLDDYTQNARLFKAIITTIITKNKYIFVRIIRTTLY